jgi:hypothetical protein
MSKYCYTLHSKPAFNVEVNSQPADQDICPLGDPMAEIKYLFN